MERGGFVEQRVSPVERRARELYLTPKGQAIAQRTRDVVRRQDRDFFAALDTGERDQLLGLLRKVYESYLDMSPQTEADPWRSRGGWPMRDASPGRVVMISGASRGIGAAVATALAASGWTLSLGVRSPAMMVLPPGGDNTLVQAYDARDRQSQKAWVAATA